MALESKNPKPKKCANPECAQTFTPSKMGQKVCGYVCGLAIAPSNRDRAVKALKQVDRQATRAARETLKKKADHMRDAQTAVNAFIRERDKDLPCICCGSFGPDEGWMTGGKWDAGHYLGRGAYPELRFVEDNIHKQLKGCNAGSSKYAAKGRTVSQGYRNRLIKKIGLARVEELEGPHEPKRYTIEDLKAITAEYRLKLRQLRASI